MEISSILEFDSKITHIASVIVRRGLGIPAVFLLEMYKPLQKVAHAGTLLSIPLIYPLVGRELYQTTLGLLEDRQALESLILKIEALLREEKIVSRS